MVVLMDGKLGDTAEVVNCLPNRERIGAGLRVVVASHNDHVIDVRLEPHRNQCVQVGLRAIVVLLSPVPGVAGTTPEAEGVQDVQVIQVRLSRV